MLVSYSEVGSQLVMKEGSGSCSFRIIREVVMSCSGIIIMRRWVTALG